MKILKLLLGIAWGIFAGGVYGETDSYYTKVISAAGLYGMECTGETHKESGLVKSTSYAN